MKKIILGLLLVSSCLMDSSSSVQSLCEVGTVFLVGLTGARVYQDIVSKQPEDTLFIGADCYGMPPYKIEKLQLSDKVVTMSITADHFEHKIGIGLGEYFGGYKTVHFDKADGDSKDSKKIISQNDWRAIAVGIATGMATYVCMKYLDKK